MGRSRTNRLSSTLTGLKKCVRRGLSWTRRAGIATTAEPGSEFVAQYTGFRVHEDLHMYRVAMDYAEYGTLANLVFQYHPGLTDYYDNDFAQRF